MILHSYTMVSTSIELWATQRRGECSELWGGHSSPPGTHWVQLLHAHPSVPLCPGRTSSTWQYCNTIYIFTNGSQGIHSEYIHIHAYMLKQPIFLWKWLFWASCVVLFCLSDVLCCLAFSIYGVIVMYMYIVQVNVPILFSTGESVLVTFSGEGLDPNVLSPSTVPLPVWWLFLPVYYTSTCTWYLFLSSCLFLVPLTHCPTSWQCSPQNTSPLALSLSSPPLGGSSSSQISILLTLFPSIGLSVLLGQRQRWDSQTHVHVSKADYRRFESHLRQLILLEK